MNGTPDRYTATAISLHWLIALMIFMSFGLGWIMTDIPGLTPTKLKLFSWHKWSGVTIFLLVCARILWRLTHKPPALPPMSRWQRITANTTHVTLYVLMFIIPLSGYLYSYAAGVPVVYFGLVELPPLIPPGAVDKDILKNIHHALNFILTLLVILHIVGALGHQFVQRDNLLARMLPFSGKGKQS